MTVFRMHLKMLLRCFTLPYGLNNPIVPKRENFVRQEFHLEYIHLEQEHQNNYMCNNYLK